MRVFQFLFSSSKPYIKYLYIALLMMSFIAIGSNLRSVVVKLFIDGITNNTQVNLWFICGLYSLLQLILVCTWLFFDYSITKFSSFYRASVVEYFIKNLYDYSYSFFQNQLSGDMISKISDAFSIANRMIFHLIHLFWNYVFQLLFCIIILATVSPLFALSTFVWIFCYITANFVLFKKEKVIYKTYAQKRANIVGFVTDFIANIINIKNYTNKNYELNNFIKYKNDMEEASCLQGFYFLKLYLLLGIITSLYAISFMILLIKGYHLNYISPGDAALVVMTNFNIINGAINLSQNFGDFVLDYGALDKALSILENEPEVKDIKNAIELEVKQGKICFDKINFNHKNATSLFENKSVIIKPKQKIGLIGYSGSGKSTFVKLILRFYNLNEGRILIDDQDIALVTQDSLRAQIAYIPQEPLLFHRSILENIRYGRIDATDNEVVKAAQKAMADDFIKQLPLGYKTLVGERGIKLSGGQRQRIVIARAILKNAPILILDEATSQLDSITESNIQMSLQDLMKDKTTIVIAHRLSTLLNMDRILVFDDGKIVQDGAHQDLINKEGLYKTMWDSQVGGFLPNKQEY